jgi:hypothetical protein
MLLGLVFVLLIQRRIPFARTWIYVLAFILLMADSGFTWIVEKTSDRMRAFLTIAVVIGGAVAGVSLISTGTIASYPDTGAFPEAPIVAGYLKPILTSNDTVEALVPADWPTYFYLWYCGVTDYHVEKAGEGGTTFLVIKKSRYSIEDMIDGPATELLDFGDMALYQALGEDDG